MYSFQLSQLMTLLKCMYREKSRLQKGATGLIY